MSSKRGRKRNDNLPPNRARDVQRAFRARRAAHLEALEQRVAELEDENATLRSALNLPPAIRPVLGKGPTGKDKPKPYSPPPSAAPSRIEVPTPLSFESSSRHGGSSGESPSSTRTHSISPAMITPLRPSPHHSQITLDGNSWDQSMLMSANQNAVQPSPPSAGYSIAPVPAHKPSTPQFAYSNAPSTSRGINTGLYLTMPQNAMSHDMSHPPDRGSLVDSYGVAAGYSVRDLREEPSHFSYSHPSFSAPETLQTTHSRSSPGTSLPMLHNQREGEPQSSTLPFTTARRAITEPQNYRSLQYPNLPPPHPSFSRVSPPRLPDASHLLRPPYTGNDQ